MDVEVRGRSQYRLYQHSLGETEGMTLEIRGNLVGCSCN